jgi:serine/threonine protein kinase
MANWIGKTLSNRYVIEEMLGQGGMSSVYKATDPNLKRVVAIKMIHTHLSNNPDFVKRFEEEAAAVAQLRHSGIIQVHDFNRDDDVYYMVLEFVPGETIQDHLKRLNNAGRQMSPKNAIEYMAGVCDAVDYAHQRGMIHRDIKPANLMLNTHGQVILMDFGIAKIVGSQRHTATGAVVGTAMYMSPEQIKGQQPDRRTDIYSLGVTLFEMVSGHPPFEADSAMTLMMMHMNDPVPNVRNLNPEVPEALVAVINKALEKDPDQRYQTCAQMAAALRNALTQLSATGSTPAPVATMIDESPLSSADPGATTYEPVPVAGTVVESGPISVPQGTVVENAPIPMPQGTIVENAPLTGVSQPDVGRTSVDSPSMRAGAAAEPKKSALALPVIVGGLLVVACLAVGGIFLVSRMMAGGGEDPLEVPIVAAVETDVPTAVVELTQETPTEIPTETAVPYTPTPDVPYVVITGIRLENDVYVMDYEVHNFPGSPQLHVHVFFNSVPPNQAGSPGSGPWKLTEGPYGNSPFTQYRTADRPSSATQLCALVANPNHSVQPNSGNCVDLP